MSNKIVLKKSSVTGRVPTTSDLDYGELALNYTDGRLYYKTSNNAIASLGGAQNFTQIDRQSYTATSGQTVFSVTYAVPYVDVYINGVHLSDEDYTATNGTSITLLEGCLAGDQVDLVGFSGGIISAAPKANGDLLVYNASTQIWENYPQSSVTVGNASKWATARTLSFTGDATGSMSVDGSANASAALTLANSGVTAGSYGTASAVPVLTIDAKGRITSASTTAVAGVSAVSYNTTTGVLSIDTSAGTTFTADIGVGSGDSPTFTALTTTGNATIGGNLTVNGTLTTINSTSLSVDDVNITLADGAANAAAADGAGLTVAGANATLTYTSADDRWNFNKNLNVGTVYGALSGNASTATTLQTARNINGVSFNGSADVTVHTAGTGISISGTAVSIDSTVVTLTGTQTLTNKTLTIPTIDNIKIGYTEIVSNTLTTQISVATGRNIRITGSTTHKIKLPDTSTLTVGLEYNIQNSSTGTVTIQASNGTAFVTVPAGLSARCTCIGTALSTPADWDATYTSFNSWTGTGAVVFSASPTISGTLTAAAITASSTISFTGGTISLAGSTTSTISIGTSATTGTTIIGGTSQTGTITIGQSTGAQTLNLATGATTASTTKTINIGTSGLSTSTTNINIGSSVSGALGTITLNNDVLTKSSITRASGATTIANQAVVQASISTTTQTAIDTFAAATYRSAKYVIQVTQGSSYQVSEILVLHNGTTTSTAEYAMMNTNGLLGTFTTDISAGNVRLLATMASATAATINITRTTIVV